MIKVSIIIPVYNVEKYLQRCLESIVNQTLQDIEIICVNDGSKDGSIEILEKFALKDSRIKLITQENAGVSAARNTGLDIAQGEYVMFLDGDDYYIKNACQIAYDSITAQGADIGVFGLFEKYWIFSKFGRVNKSIRKALKTITPNLWLFQTFCWNKIYKKEFLSKNNLKFPAGIKTSEDGIFSLCCMFNNPKYCFINKALYVYRKNRFGSATAQNGIKNDLIALKAFYGMEIFKKQSLEIQLRVIEKFCSGVWSYYKKCRKSEDVSLFLEFVESKYKKQDLEQFKKYRQLKGAV